MTDNEAAKRLLDAALAHVPFDGWSEAALKAASAETGIDPQEARRLFPRGGVDLALAYHKAGDQAMLDRLAEADLSEMRFRDRIAAAVRYRLEAVEDKELVRRGMALFALPHHAPDGMKALWETCDSIWTALGDTSDDVNWYTKRMTLSGVYSSTVLFWLGDDSPGHERSWAFLDRRIDDVMQIEKFKAQARESKLLSGLLAGPLSALGRIRAPSATPPTGMPGRWSGGR